jgi:hypothetical protein
MHSTIISNEHSGAVYILISSGTGAGYVVAHRELPLLGAIRMSALPHLVYAYNSRLYPIYFPP